MPTARCTKPRPRRTQPSTTTERRTVLLLAVRTDRETDLRDDYVARQVAEFRVGGALESKLRHVAGALMVNHLRQDGPIGVGSLRSRATIGNSRQLALHLFELLLADLAPRVTLPHNPQRIIRSGCLLPAIAERAGDV